MKVLFMIREDFEKNMAGDTIVAKSLRKYLIEEGIQVDFCDDTIESIRDYDRVHIFNTVRTYESYKYMKYAKMNRKKIILTPIYWDLREYFYQTIQLSRVQLFNQYEDKRKYLFDQCDIFLPHSKMEADLILKNYHPCSKYTIVPYGVEEIFMKGTSHYLLDKYGIDQYILCVARIHPQKNQLTLLKALKDENIPIVLIGNVNDQEYFRKCKQYFKPKDLFYIAKREELSSIYKSAKVHVLSSWIEFPGLSSLEAGMAGTHVVTTFKGSTKEIFKDYVQYCNPKDPQSIHDAVMKAYYDPTNLKLQTFIKEHYSWSNIAKRVKKIYETL